MKNIAVDMDGKGRGTGPYGGVWYRNRNDRSWVLMTGRGRDISVGFDNTLYLVGTNGFTYEWNSATKRYIKITGPGKVKRVDAYSSMYFAVITEAG